VRFKVFRYGEPMVLSAVLPVLHSLGVRVTDERPYEIAARRRHDLPLRLRSDLPPAHGARRGAPHVENAFPAAWRGEAEVDGFNELVCRRA
jgi:glutamate dehydrogenase